MAIQTSGLVKSYGKHQVLGGVDLCVPRGSVYALLGGNGAGKTTTVRILATLSRPDGGQVRVAGFDVLYACQDAEHDRGAGLRSIPQALGVRRAFGIVRAMHGAMLLLLVWLLHLFHLGPIAWWGLVVVTALLFYEHSIVSPRDMRRLNAAFFTLNGIISVLFFCFVAMAVTFRH